MALNKVSLKSGIKSLMEDMFSRTDNTEQAMEDFATELSNLIDAFVKTATVTTPAGVAVATAGSAVAQTGATTSPGIGSIS